MADGRKTRDEGAAAGRGVGAPSRVNTVNVAGFCGVALVGVVLDQATKAWARTTLAGGRVTVVPDVLDLVLVKNTGAAFSIGSGSTWVFALLAVGIVAACAAWVLRERTLSAPLACALGAVAGGGVGNLIDRVVAGEVTDFFATTFMDFPVFNVADIFVTCGVVLVMWLWWRWEGERPAA